MKMKIPIIATSLLKFGELWDKSINDLIREVGKKVLEDAGIQSSDIDSLFIANEFSSEASGQSMLNSVVFEELGISNVVCVKAGDASGSLAIKQAANSILAGQNKVSMVLGVEKVADLKSGEMLALASSLISQQEESFMGATIPSQFALITRKYLYDFKLKAADLSFIPSRNHKNALHNEHAQYRFELPEEKISSSSLLSDPIRMLDCASYCDGAAAIILCNEKISDDFNNKIKGYLIGSALASDSLALSKRKSITTIESTVKAAKEAYALSGIKQKDINLLEVYDFVPIAEVLSVEDLGFAKKGQGIKFIKDNENINLSGGIKGCGNAIGATGVRQAVDVINNLKRKNMEYGLTHTLGGTGCISVVNIFGGS